MKTLIFATAIRILTPVFLLFSVYILLRGHNHPGGGFIGGLIGSITFVFHVLAHGSQRTAKEYFSMTFYRYEREPASSRPNHMWHLLTKNLLSKKSREEERKYYYLIRLRPSFLMATGLLVAAISGLIGLIYGKPFMTGIWSQTKFPLIGSVGTPLLFDAGVYLLVLGMVLKMIFTMSKDQT
ncbi:MnhB domain-containing protein [Pontibacter sp. MBLB2868]|uniref:MnhB domain-containing protein n=1 Tax=Pontibacter sp. MBLB2868 TaxID=3451555 RepID=UPI003F75343A